MDNWTRGLSDGIFAEDKHMGMRDLDDNTRMFDLMHVPLSL